MTTTADAVAATRGSSRPKMTTVAPHAAMNTPQRAQPFSELRRVMPDRGAAVALRRGSWTARPASRGRPLWGLRARVRARDLAAISRIVHRLRQGEFRSLVLLRVEQLLKSLARVSTLESLDNLAVLPDPEARRLVHVTDAGK